MSFTLSATSVPNTPDKFSAGGLPTTRMKGGLPRFIEIILSLAGLVVIIPLLVPAAIGIFLSSPGPVIFRQTRVGRNGQNFTLYKLRTMHQSDGGPQLTSDGDRRIFSTGRILRKTKIDELPALWNTLNGDMSLVGPRPEVPRYVDLGNPMWRQVLLNKPGITHPVSLLLCNEEALLAMKDDPEDFYLRALLPFKLKGYIDYSTGRNWQSDVVVMWNTVMTITRPDRSSNPPSIEFNI